MIVRKVCHNTKLCDQIIGDEGERGIIGNFLQYEEIMPGLQA
jgi:hypothetical protein